MLEPSLIRLLYLGDRVDVCVSFAWMVQIRGAK